MAGKGFFRIVRRTACRKPDKPSPTSPTSRTARQACQVGQVGQAKPDGKPRRKRASPTSRLEARLSPIKPLPYRSTASPGRAQRSHAKAQERASPPGAARKLAGFAGQAGRQRQGNRATRKAGMADSAFHPDFCAVFPPISTRFPPGERPFTGARSSPLQAHGYHMGARLFLYGAAVNFSADDFLYGRGLNLARTARSLSAQSARRGRHGTAGRGESVMHENARCKRLKLHETARCGQRRAWRVSSLTGTAGKCTPKNSAGKILNRTYLRHYLSEFSAPEKRKARPDLTLNAPTIGGDVP